MAPRSRSASEVVGLLDNDLRCAFAPVDLDAVGRAVRDGGVVVPRATTFDVVQLIYPDRNGFLPYEPGFDQRMRYAQPVVGDVT